MSWVQEAVRSLGSHLGIEHLRMNERGVCVLREDDVTISIEDKDHTVLLCVARPMPFITEDLMEQSLRMTHYRSSQAVPVGVCLTKENHLIFFAHLERSTVTSQRLYETLRLLHRFSDNIHHATRR